ncbi:catalase-like domain-containing protein [Kalaharituber pfeilii]|nr:catalase-like domain-containing protein [Kalaharituber pfeilii]
MSNIGTTNPLEHPIQAAKTAVGTAGGDPRPEQRMKTMMNINEGPATIAAKVTGVQGAGVREDNDPYFTNNEGIPWPDPAHSLNVGGIPVISDTFLLQKQQTFNRSKTLERAVHPCGSGAFGYFECTKDMSHLTKATFLSQAGIKTPIAARFSTVTFGREFPDSGRNPHGFALKFYTEEGNYDLVGLNWPIFFCRDPIQGPDVIRSQQRNPKNFLLDYNSLFDFLANVPESNHAGLMLFSDHGTPVGWRFNHGYGCHSFKWVNREGGFVYVKYHFIADHGQKQFTSAEAVRVSGEDPDFAKRDLYRAIENGEQITWTAKVQIMQPHEADPNKLGFDPFDVTKVWPRSMFPMHEFGKLVLNKNPENFHRDIEQLAFSPGSMVPGIEASPDMLLQFRTFFYRDAQYHRLGVNIHQIPVNCPFMAKSYSSINFDGPLRSDANTGMNPHYVPNSFTDKFRPDCAETPVQVADNILSRQSHHYHEGKASEYDQARELYTRVMSATQRKNTWSNTAEVLKLVDYAEIQKKYLAQCWAIHPEYSRGIYDLLPEKKFRFEEVEELGGRAAEMGKVKDFRPAGSSGVKGFPVQTLPLLG